MEAALKDVRILDFTHMYAGPFCTLLLRELGAEVIKVERPEEGDPVRGSPPFTEGGESSAFIMLNRGKKSVTLNLSKEEGREICLSLVKNADVVIENFTPGSMERLGLGSKRLLEMNPKLIYASISAFGHKGPYSKLIGFDPIIQAMGGIISVTGYPELPPVKVGIPIADYLGGLFCAISILASLHYRSLTGKGQVIDISIQDCVFLPTIIWQGPTVFIEKKIPERRGNSDAYVVPANIYPAKDGYVYIGCIGIAQVERLFKVIGREDLVNSPLCARQSERIRFREEFDRLIKEWTEKRCVEEIWKAFIDADIPCSPIPDIKTLCEDPHLKSREMVIEVDQVVSGRTKVPGSVFKLSETPGEPRLPAPFLGEHNLEIYGSMLGYGEEKLNELAEKGII